MEWMNEWMKSMKIIIAMEIKTKWFVVGRKYTKTKREIGTGLGTGGRQAIVLVN